MYFTTGLVLLLAVVWQADSRNPAVQPKKGYHVAAPVKHIRSLGVDKQKRYTYLGGVRGLPYSQNNGQNWPYIYNYQVTPISASGYQPLAATGYPSVVRPFAPVPLVQGYVTGHVTQPMATRINNYGGYIYESN